MKTSFILFVLFLWTETLADQSPGPGPQYADVVFLVDSSDHLGIKNVPFVKTFLNKMIASLPIEANKYRVALAQYSDQLHSEFQLGTFKGKGPMLNYIRNNFSFMGGSLRLGNALREAHQTYFSATAQGRDKKQFPPILVVLASAKSEDDVEEAAEALRQDGVRIISVGVQRAAEDDLKAMATAQFHFHLRTVRDLSTFSQNMTQAIRDAVQYRPTGHPADLEVPFPESCRKDSLIDLMFLVDESFGSTQNLRNLQTFLENLTGSLDVKENCVQLGLMSYSGSTQVLASLNSSRSQYEFQQQIQKLSVRAGRANLETAIEQLRREGFSEASGSRRAQGVPQIAVVVTNRPSDDPVRDAAFRLRLEGVTVFAMNMQGANETQLEEIVSYPPRQTISPMTSYAGLGNYSKTFLKKLQSEIWSQISTQGEQLELDKTGCVDTKEADIYFLIDGSGSISGSQFEQIKKFMLEVTDMFNIGPDKIRVGVVQYSFDSVMEFDIDVYKDNIGVRKAIDNIKQLKGGTYTGKALDFTLHIMKKGRNARAREIPCYLIVLTDGQSQDEVAEPAKRIRDEQITIHAVGIGEANVEELVQIAGVEEKVNFGQNFDALKSIKNEVVHRICKEKGCEDMKADIMFLVDGSSSIGYTNFGKMKTFMQTLLTKIQIGADKAQIGVAQFSDYNKEEFPLNKFSTQQEISDEIGGMNLITGNTLTGSALRFIEPYFTQSKGARPGVRKFLILITDGEAQDDVQEPAVALRDQGVIIFSVGVYGANRTQLEEISGDGSLVFYVENFKDLKDIENELIFRVCTLHDCKRIMLLDVVFVLDHSLSITSEQQDSMLNLTTHLVKKSDVGRDRVQFGALIYSDDPKVLFYLNTYSNRSAIIEALRKGRITKSSTFTAKALNHSLTLFQEEHGSRIKQNVKQMLIVITDGASTDWPQLNDTAWKLRSKGITIMAVGVGAANQNELETIAGSKANTIHVENFDKLKDVYLPLQESMCNSAQEVCGLQEADVVFLFDGSDMVSDSGFVTMTTFLSDLIDNFDIQSRRMKIGMAQFGSRYQKIIELESSLTQSQWKAQFQTVTKIKGPPRINMALHNVRSMFDPSAGGRRNAGVPQMLVVIVSGDLRYSMVGAREALKALRALGICVLALGIGDVRKDQLLPITGNPEKIFTYGDFSKLSDVNVKKRMVREICQSCGKTRCFVDVVVGFDISTHLQGQPLFQGHPRLESHLPGILEDITSIKGVSCGAGADTQVSVAFKVNSDQEFPAKFQIYQTAVFDSLLRVTVSGPTRLNAQFLESLWDTFDDRSASRGQVLLIFSDGLQGESITMLESRADRLREAGLDALFVVSLNTTVHDEFSSFEFGKGFHYRTHLNIGMTEVGGMLSQYLGNIAERTCCCTFCKCPGVPGPQGPRGQLALKGSTGLKGNRGHRGEDGDPGRRGDTGLPGDKGIAGCPGERGQKGAKGFSGQKGEHGENGLDGLDGEEGVHGFPGEKGEKGELGFQGSPGSRGPSGEYGGKGFRGDPGNPGQASNIKGQKGSKGEQGRQGRAGLKGMPGSPSSGGGEGREGRRGLQGAVGVPGSLGPQGMQGAEGLQGPQGSSGNPGTKGEKGSQGHKGPQGLPGLAGPKGSTGRPGLWGKKGEPGVPGVRGPVGPTGQRGRQGDDGTPGYGDMGRKGVKGPRGLPGDMGQKGEVGDPGIPGGPGPKGFRGLTLTVGLQGGRGSPGSPGPPGRRGPKGMAGLPVYSQCDLIQFVRDHSPCWEGKCPVYPTELVFALDQSSGITERRFNETRDMIASIISDLNIRESHCPVGAKVTVLSYDSNVSYLIRGSDYHSKRQLLQLLSQIRYQVPTEARDIGHAMRYVARHVFKRTRAGANVRRVAVFFSNGAATSRSSIITATMEFNALDISPAVFAFNERGFLDEAFGFDDTGTFQLIPVPPNGEYEPLERLQRCTLCYDKCFANACAREILLPEDSYMDVAFLIDNSRNLAGDEFKALKGVVSLMIDNFNIASDPLVSDSGDRVALLSYSTWSRSRRNKTTVKTEFDFTTYSNQALMKDYIQTSLQQLSGDATIGHALMWTMENLFSETHSRKHKVIFVVSAGENHEKLEFVRKVALRAKCQGYVIFVISLGSTPTNDLEELASHPADHHLIQLGRIHKPDLNYIVKFLKPFVHAVRRGFNSYPPPMLEDACRLINSKREDGPNRDVQFINELLEISSDENTFFSQELSAAKDSSFLLEDDGHGHLVYIPSQMVEPKIVAINYDSDQEPTDTAGQEKHGRTEESNLSFKPEDVSLQDYYMDVAFLIDASQRVGDDEFKEVKAFVSSVLDYFHVTPDPLTSIIGDRVAVLSYSPSGYRPNTEDCPVYLEFDLLTYNSRDQMKHHLQDSVQQLNGDAFTGHALQWTIDNVFVGTPNLKKNKVIFIISAGETNPVDKEVLRNVSQIAKCQGYTIFVFSFGPTHSDKELEELASQPLDHHLVQLGRTHKPDFNYVIRFLRPFVHSIRRAINSYPSDELRAKCPNVTYPSPESIDTENTVFLIPEMYEIERGDNGLFGEPGSWEQHFSALGNNQRNDSQIAMGLMQKLYMLFSTGDMMLKDKGEAQPEETPAPVTDRQDRKDGESTG